MEPRIFIRPGVGISADILQQQELEFKRLFVEQSVLIYVQQGIKVLRWEGGEYIIRAGEAIAVAGGQSVDITNRLAEDGGYRAHWLVCDKGLVDSYAEAHPQQPAIVGALPIQQRSPEFRVALEHALLAVRDETIPADIARHRMAELLLWIGLHGGRFSPVRALTLGSKIRHLVGRDLAHEWSAAQVASAFAMSEATLRRKLGDEGTTLSAILLDTRMSFALKLLQSTRQPVTQIAVNVGFCTPSHFAARFKDRFGFTPTAIRTPCRATAQPISLRRTQQPSQAVDGQLLYKK
ncbi:helix-turn-helix transcriptional regulator [Acidovorax facilis]|uniref:helix-turn-helix transcriptional regulator n=1 Tax=Acidovorax facilis TaxID=12917 RepID=UPI003CFBB712